MQPSLPGKPPERVLWPDAVCIPRPSPCQLSKAEEETISSYQISWKYRCYEHVSFRLMIPLTNIFWLCDYVSSSHLTTSVCFCRHGHCAKMCKGHSCHQKSSGSCWLKDQWLARWHFAAAIDPTLLMEKMEAASAYCAWWAANACDIVWWHRQTENFQLLGEKSYWHAWCRQMSVATWDSSWFPGRLDFGLCSYLRTGAFYDCSIVLIVFLSFFKRIWHDLTWSDPADIDTGMT